MYQILVDFDTGNATNLHPASAFCSPVGGRIKTGLTL